MIHDDHIHLRAHNKPPLPHELEEIIEISEQRGVVPGIREHAALPRDYRLGEHKDFEYAMIPGEEERFISLFKGTNIRIGLEIDYLPGYEDETLGIMNSLLQAASSAGVGVSGVNGSVHLLPGDLNDLGIDKGKVKDIIWDLDENLFETHIKQRGVKKVIDDYFGRMRDLVRSRMFDTLSHIELLRKFDRVGTNGESIYFGDDEKYFQKSALSVLELVAETGMAAEINMAGYYNLLGRPYMSQELLNACSEMKIPICIASDSHKPDGIAARFGDAYKMCRDAGIEKLATIDKRKIKFYEY